MEEKKELQNQDERVVEIELERLRGFVNHPFKVQADSQMIELQESIKKYGTLIINVFPTSYGIISIPPNLLLLYFVTLLLLRHLNQILKSSITKT